MRFVHALVLTAVFTAFQGSARAETLFPGAVARPNNRGDQVIFYYDVRDDVRDVIGQSRIAPARPAP